MQNTHTDYMVIDAYNNATGFISFVNPLLYYHWGDRLSTASDYNGVDMRGEVVLLNRNVRIIGNNSDSWGAQIVVSDSLELDGTFREGQLIMDNVELYNCSQRNTHKAAIRFERASTK